MLERVRQTEPLPRRKLPPPSSAPAAGRDSNRQLFSRQQSANQSIPGPRRKDTVVPLAWRKISGDSELLAPPNSASAPTSPLHVHATSVWPPEWWRGERFVWQPCDFEPFLLLLIQVVKLLESWFSFFFLSSHSTSVHTSHLPPHSWMNRLLGASGSDTTSCTVTPLLYPFYVDFGNYICSIFAVIFLMIVCYLWLVSYSLS